MSDILRRKADVVIHDDGIAAVGKSLAAPAGAEVVQATGRAMRPGLVNTRHHRFQRLARAAARPARALIG